MKTRKLAIAVLVGALTPAGSVLAQTIVRVDGEAPAGGNGSSWVAAMNDLHDALAAAAAGGVDEIWVAAGTYTPAPPDGDRTLSFDLADGAGLYGGFGGAETARDQRDPEAHVTILSGDLNGDDDIGVDPDDNSLHVVTGTDLGSTTVIDGFTIAAGAGDDDSGQGTGGVGGAGGGLLLRRCDLIVSACLITRNKARLGSGVYSEDGSPTLAGCEVSVNYSARSGEGGGVYATSAGTDELTLVDCNISFNAATQGHFATGHGAGVYCDPGVVLDASGCTFESNYTWHNTTYGDATTGGAIRIYADGSTITGCTFQSNYSSLGAGIYSSGDITVVNSVFLGNRAVEVGCVGPECNGAPDVFSGHGGGLYVPWNAAAEVVNCTFAANWAAKTGAGAIMDGVVANSVLWGNETHPVCCGEDELPVVRAQIDGAVDILYCDVEGLLQTIPGEDPPDPANYPGSFETAPMFVAYPEVSTLGHLLDAGDLHLQAGSACIDAGDNGAVPPGITLDVEGNARFVDDPATADSGSGGAPVVDLGALEYGGFAVVPGDLNGDGVVDVVDLLQLLGAWGPCPGCSADLNGDGVVSVVDLLELLGNWG